MALTAEPLPRNANGKVMKRQLREAWAAGQA
jgi:acyl-coenzyme A synthetase/AMP-(fatty) acid ligase